jgi:CHAD domain-containing protein
VSLKRFCGWEPRVIVRYTHDDAGRCTGEVHKRETEWDQRERAWMEALDYFESGLCRRCGHHLSDTTDPDNDPELLEAGHQWIADSTECVACRVLIDAERREHKRNEDGAGAVIHSARLVAKKPRKRNPRVQRAEPRP